MLNTVFSPWPAFTEAEAGAVKCVLLSNKVNYWAGSKCREFEKAFAAFVDCDYAIAVANGTVVLDLVLNVLGISRDDEVPQNQSYYVCALGGIVIDDIQDSVTVVGAPAKIIKRIAL